MGSKTGTMGVGLVLLLLLGLVVWAAGVPRAVQDLTRPAQPYYSSDGVRAASTVYAFPSNLGNVELDTTGAIGHAVDKHGIDAIEALNMARQGLCKPYLPCGRSFYSLEEGVKGYFKCTLTSGATWLVPFLVDGLLNRLVAMTAYPTRPDYLPRIQQPGDCFPIELLPSILYDGGDDDTDQTQP